MNNLHGLVMDDILKSILTKETARIMKTQEEKIRILIYEVSKENWGNAGVLGIDM